jgi:hypothetical protein
MAKTVVSDIVIPENYERYLIERTAEEARFVQSGIIEMDGQFDEIANAGGRIVNMPFFQDLTGARQVLSDSADLTVNNINTAQDAAVMHNDGQAWSVNLLSSLLSGEDPMGAIADLVGEYWARVDEDTLLATLKGVFAIASMTGNENDIAVEDSGLYDSESTLNGETFIETLQTLGDQKQRVTAIALHSATEASLLKQDLIDFIPDSSGAATIPTFQGRLVIVDDTMPTRAGTTSGTVYTSYLFGAGAVARGNANLAGRSIRGGFGNEAVEFSREALASDDILINRRRYIMHPRGVRFLDASVAGQSPTDAELEAAANWLRVYEAKNVRLIKVDHNNL